MSKDLSVRSVELLRFISDSPDGIASTSAILSFCNDHDLAEYRINELLKADLIAVSKYSDPPKRNPNDPPIFFLTGTPSEFCITPSGKDYLASLDWELEQMRQERAEQNRNIERRAREHLMDKRHNWMVTIVGTAIGAAISSGVILIVEHILIPLFTK